MCRGAGGGDPAAGCCRPVVVLSWINASDVGRRRRHVGRRRVGLTAMGAAGLRQASERGGVRFLRDRVASWIMEGASSVAGVRLAAARRWRCRWLVNAAGTHSRAIAAESGHRFPSMRASGTYSYSPVRRPPAGCPMSSIRSGTLVSAGTGPVHLRGRALERSKCRAGRLRRRPSFVRDVAWPRWLIAYRRSRPSGWQAPGPTLRL